MNQVSEPQPSKLNLRGSLIEQSTLVRIFVVSRPSYG